jgi:cytochrome c biogenesis protein CcmG/thiol:disulfide interchange protein DsbE
MRWGTVAPLGVFLALSLAFAISLMRGPEPPQAVELRPAPAFDLPGLAPGEAGLSSAELAGRVTLINVFASRCASCALEHPVWMEVARRGEAEVYGVAWQDKPGAARAWLDGRGDPYAGAADDADGRLGLDLGVTGTPETFVIDRRGRIRRHLVGPVTPTLWRNELQPLIARLQAES